MRHTVSTSNYYLAIALLDIIKEVRCRQNICIIDLNCCLSLNDLFNTVSQCGNDGTLIYLIGGQGIYSELLGCFDMIDMSESINAIQMFIQSSKGVSPAQLNRYIVSCLALDKLSKSQIHISILSGKMKISSVGELVNLSVASVHNQIRISASKMNFSSLLRFRYFISKEFSSRGNNGRGILLDSPLRSRSGGLLYE
ncbi:hypothetical protein [Citrobacter youngae]|uniref:Uncharacterized protein n=1 Tax=Citrobacter youngae ATCC 29220 TaxID=500640 RepID=D4B999_9ENTR|nr:hypothetical protein [Citrobacter youngae]EFE08760.1 hypothetical protein CIT292_07039 [Citrobacter youngae ATCC 29220]